MPDFEQLRTAQLLTDLDTGTSDMHQPGQRQACLVRVLRVFACSYIRPRM